MEKILQKFLGKTLMIRLISLGDQVFLSIANFLLTIILARHYSEATLAGYGIGLAIATLLQGVQRSCYVIQNSVLPADAMRRRANKIMGQQLLVLGGLLAGEVVILTISACIWGTGEYFLAIAYSTLVCTLVYIPLDFDRVMLIKHEKFVQPFMTSAIFLALCVSLFLMASFYHAGFETIMLLLGLFTIFKLAWLVLSIGRPDFFWGWRLLRRDLRDNFKSSLLGVAGFAGFSSIPLFILGTVSPPLQAAAFGATKGLLQPMMVIIRSFDVIDKNYFQKNITDAAGMRQALFRLLVAYGALSSVALLFVAVFGNLVVHLAYGEKYSAFGSLLTGWGMIFVMTAVSYPLETVIVKLGKLNLYNVQRIVSGLVGLVLAVFLCGPFGAWGALMACIGGWITSVIFALWLVREIAFPPAPRNVSPEVRV